MRFGQAPIGGFFIALMAANAALGDTITSSLGTNTTSPLISGSCMYVDQGGTTDTKACGAAGTYWGTLFGLIPLNGNAGTPSAITLTNATNIPAGNLTGTISVNRFNGGVGASASTVLFGDGTWNTPAGGVTPAGASGDFQLNSGSGGLSPLTPGAGVATLLTSFSSTNLRGALTDETGAGSAVFAISPTLVTPDLGTPSAINLAHGTSLPIAGIAGLGTGVGAWFAAPSSANLYTAMSSKTGSGGSLVFSTSPTLATPDLGTPSSINLANATSIPAGNLTGTVSVNRFNSGTNADTSHFLRGDGTWATPASGGSPAGSGGELQYNNAGSFGAVTLGTGLQMVAGTFSQTNVVNDQSAGDYTVLTGDAVKTVLVGNSHTYTLAQAGTTGFASGWSGCLLNTTSSNATVNTTTSLFKGAGGGTSMTLRPGAWACPASDGTNYPTVLGSSDGADLTAGTVTNAKLATMATHTIKGNNTGSTAAPIDLTQAQLTAEVNAMVGDSGSGGTKGAVPAPGSGDTAAGKYLKADGTWAVPTGSGSSSPGGSSGNIQYNNAGAFGGRATSGNGTTVVTTTGTQTSGKCVTIDANGNHVADSSACSGSSSAMTLVSTQTANNTGQSLTWTGLTGTDYQLRCNLTPATNSIDIYAQVSEDAGSTWGGSTAYEWNGYGAQGASGTFVSGGSTGDVGLKVKANGTLVNTGSHVFTMNFFNLSGTTTHRMTGNATIASSSRQAISIGGSYLTDTNAINALRVTTSSGNLSSGTCSLYAIGT